MPLQHMPINPIIIICAYNEEAWIGRTLDLIREIRIKIPIIVVNDGSTDHTVEIAEAKGARVISFPQNRGKANAFFAGLRSAVKQGATSVLTLDADMLRLDRRTMLQMIRLAEDATKERKKHMAVAAMQELIDVGKESIPLAEGTYYSGLRAFSLPAMHALLVHRHKKLVRGFALEDFLNREFEIKQRTELTHTLFVQRSPFASPTAHAREARDIIRFNQRGARVMWNPQHQKKGIVHPKRIIKKRPK